MPGWIRKNGAYRQISVPEFYELATATVTSGGTGYTTAMELVIDPVSTGDQGAIIAIDEVGESGEIVTYHIANRGKYATDASIIHPTYTVTGGTHTGIDAQLTLTAEAYTGLNTAAFVSMDDEWQPINAVYMKKGSNWRLLYEPAPAQPNPPEPIVTVAVKYMAIAPNGKVYTSDDGYAYTETSTIETSSTGRILFYCDDGYYYTAIKNGTTSDAKRTKDGITWESLNVPNNLGMAVFAKGGDGNYAFLNNNDNKVYYTTDPVNGTWNSFYVANSGLDWNNLFWADLGLNNQYWYLSAATSTTAYRFIVGSSVSTLTLTNKQNYGRLEKCNNLIYYPYYKTEQSGYTAGGSRAPSIRIVTLYTYVHSVSFDGVAFNNTNNTFSQVMNDTRNSMAYNNNIYCSNRVSSGSAVSYFLNSWTVYNFSYGGLFLTSLTGNFCAFYNSTVQSSLVTKSSDGQTWTATQPVFPAGITSGSLNVPNKVGLRVYWVNYDSGLVYNNIIATADGTTFSMVTGLDPETMYNVGSPTMTATEGNLGYALASKMG